MITTYGCALMLALSGAPAGSGPTPAAKPAPQKAAPIQLAAKPDLPVSKAQPKAKDAASGAAAVVADVQKYYERIKDYSADFIQVYTKVALSQTSELRGKLQIKKPGLMRWAYEKPVEKLWIVNGKTLYVADPEFEQVFIDPNFKTAELGNSISFLWGEGKIDASFDAKLGDAKTYGFDPAARTLELTPKKGATYAKLVLAVSAATGEVTESIIFETAGNKNHFKFKGAKINTGLEEALFQYTPPKGWEVIYR